MNDNSEALVMASADLCMKRWRAEVLLLTAVAPIGRFGLGLARRSGMRPDLFENIDTSAIWIALEYAEQTGAIAVYDEHSLLEADRPHDWPLGLPWTTARVPRAMKYCRAALRMTGCWCSDDDRQFIAGSRWGPGPLNVLFTRMGKYEAERSVPELTAELWDLAMEWDQLAAAARQDRRAVA